MVMKMASGDNSPSGRVPGRAPEPPEMGSTMAAASVCFVKIGLGTRYFPLRRIYGREGEIGGRPRGPHLP